MRKSIFLSVLLFVFLLSLVSCKTEYEKIRTSNDPVLILEKANDMYKKKDYLKAQSLYDIIIPFYRGKKEAEDLFFKYAYTYYNLDDFILASHYFDNFAKTFTNSAKREDASFMAAYSNYLMSPSYRLDQTYTYKAIAELQLFVNNYPTSDRVSQCNNIIDELRAKLELKSIEQGKLYYKIRDYQAAIVSFKNTLVDYPDTERIEELYFYIIKSAYLLAENSIYDKKKERFEETIKYYNQFKKRYPRSKFHKDLRNDIEKTNDELKSLSV